MNNYSENVNQIMRIAEAYAKESLSAFITPAHLLKSLLHKDIGLIEFINSIDKDYYYILDWANHHIEQSPRASNVFKKPVLSEETETVVREAQSYQAKLGFTQLEPILLLISVVTPGVGYSFEQLKSLLLSPEELLSGIQPGDKPKVKGTSPNVTSSDNLKKYCINKNEFIQINTPDPIIGFEKELSTIYAILGRRFKSNLIITGESGVGKTALLTKFIQRIISHEVPSMIANSVVYELTLSSLVSDANYKGEIEDRFKNVIKEIKLNENAILLIESIDKIVDKQGLLFGALNILKQELNNSTILFICTTTTEGFTKYIEPDKELVSKFEKLTITEPDQGACFRIIKGGISSYEKYHSLTITDEVITEAIRLSKRYMSERSLPDSVFDLLDRTMSLIKITNDRSEKDISTIQGNLQDVKNEITINSIDENSKAVNWIHFEIYNRISRLLTVQVGDDRIDFSKSDKTDENIAHLEILLAKLLDLAKNKHTTVTIADLYVAIAEQTGIPVGKLQTKERDKLINAESSLRQRVVGQDHAIEIIVNALKISGANLHEKGKPIGSFFLLGPTGTGKTELAKALATFLFEDENSMIRFDMSEFSESHSAALLLGAPPGYVGYEEGGVLVNKIRQKPYSVVLFDEIEKAHSDVYNVFLQIIGEGRLHDKLGRLGDFSNALILFTSNVASDFVFNSFENNKIPESAELMKILSQHFRQEFLGRFKDFGGAIIPFAPITEEIVLKIFDINLRKFTSSLDERGIKLIINDETRRSLAMSGFTKQFGARPILGIIYNRIKQPVAELLLNEKITLGSVVELQKAGDDYKLIY